MIVPPSHGRCAGCSRRVDDQFPAMGRSGDRRARRVGFRNGADILRMIGDTHPVERGIDLDVVADGVLDGLPRSVFVGVCWSCLGVAEYVGVERPARMRTYVSPKYAFLS